MIGGRVSTQVAFGFPQAGLGGVRTIGEHERQRANGAEGGTLTRQLLRNPVDPAEHRLDLPVEHDHYAVRFDEADGPLPILGGQSVVDRFANQPLPLEPPTSPAV